MAEWFKAAVLKTVECQSSVGSNPTPSAIDPVLPGLRIHKEVSKQNQRRDGRVG